MIALLIVLSAHAVDRETALDNAAAYAYHQWTMTEVNTSASCSTDYASTYEPGTYRGLPYDWGGYMTIETFDDQIADGYGAGSHSWHGILSCTAGLDCSGFLSMVWETGHHSTSTFSATTHDIGLSELERADAVNDAGSHVVMYTHETDAGTPIFYEASGGADKTRLNNTAGWSYLNGYQPIRFDGITDGASTGTSSRPRDILSFPFEDLRWTAGAASDAIDSYSCAPSTNESGPEVLYRFEALTAGVLHVVLSDDQGVDVDVHVLTAPSGDACLARHDTELELEVGPGEIWLALDTWVSGQEYPGPFLLTATFTGEVGTPEELPDDGTPDDTGTDPTEDPVPGGGTRTGDDDEQPAGPGARRPVEEPKGCGCATGVGTPWLAGLVGLLALRRRR